MLKQLKNKIEIPLLVMAVILIVSIVIYSFGFSGNTDKEKSDASVLQRVQALEDKLNDTNLYRNQTGDTNQGMQFRFNRIEGSLKLKTDLLAERIDTLQSRIKELEDNVKKLHKKGGLSEKNNKEKPNTTPPNKTHSDKKVDAKQPKGGKQITDQNTSKPPNKRFVHIVKRGETYFSISRKYGMKVQDLLKINNKTKGSIIYPGQKLWISEK